MPAGRPPTPTNKLKLHGGFRKERHASRDKEPVATGQPHELYPLAGDAKFLWDFIVPKLCTSKVAREIDSPELFAMARWWDKWRQWDTATEVSSEAYRCQQMALCWKQFQLIASKFGLTPSDRTKLQADVPAKDDLEAMLA